MPTEEIKKSKIRNIIILVVVSLLVVSLVLYLCDCYKVYEESKKEIPVLDGILAEISTIELDHYLLENPSTTIYICTTQDTICRNYESKLIQLIEKKALKDDIIYLNVTEEEKDGFVEEFNNKYHYKVKLGKRFPAYVVFDEGKITGILQEKEKDLTIQKTKQFIELNEIGD